METIGIDSNREKTRNEFRKTVVIINKVFLKTCEDLINESEDCILVPAVKSYLDHIQKALIKLDLDNDNVENKSLAEIGAFFDNFQSSLSPDEGESTVTTRKRENLGNACMTTESGESPSKRSRDDTTSVPGSSKSASSLQTTQSPLAGPSPKPQNTNNAASTTDTDCLENARNDEMNDTESAPPAPVPGSTIVVEQDAVYSIRCKVFVLANGIYNEKGVGVLYIKSLFEGKLDQVLVRADGVLGKILLNARIIPNLPIKKASPKDLIVILGTGNAQAEKNTFLIRLKDEKSATELFDKLTTLSK